MAGIGGEDAAYVQEILARDGGYATPKIDVRAVVFRDDRILLAREREDGLWTAPGGWCDVLASPRENAERETLEETGYRVRATRLLALYDRALHPHVPEFPFHAYKAIPVHLVGGEAATSNETDAVGWFRLDDLQPLSIARVTPWQLRRMFELRDRPEASADFD